MNILQATKIYEGLKKHSNIVANIDKDFFFDFTATLFENIEYYKDLCKLKTKQNEQLKKSLKGIINQQNKTIDTLTNQLIGLNVYNYKGETETILSNKQEVLDYFIQINKEE